MKQVEIKTHETIKFKDDEALTTKHLIEMILNRPPAGGFSLKDITDRNQIDQALKDAKDGFPVTLEDADFEVLHTLAKAMQWPVRDVFISEFVESLSTVKSYKPGDFADLRPSENGKEKKLEKVK